MDMLGIRKYVHELGNSMVASDRSLESILNQTIPNLSQIYIWSGMTYWVSKSMYLRWGIQIFGRWMPLASLKVQRPSKKRLRASKVAGQLPMTFWHNNQKYSSMVR